MADPKKLISLYDRVAQALGTYQESEKNKAAVEWFEEEVSMLVKPLPQQRQIVRDPKHISKSGEIKGAMMMFLYDPINEKTLPYYDRFPLVIPVEPFANGKGFRGLNLHYLNYYDRATLLDMLQDLGAPGAIKLNRISFDVLAKIRKFRSYKACVRSYRSDRIITNIALVPRGLWETAIFLPIEDFRKVRNKQAIWKESRQIIRKT